MVLHKKEKVQTAFCFLSAALLMFLVLAALAMFCRV